MLQSLDKMFEAQAAPVRPRTWSVIPAFLDAEVAAGGSRSSRAKTRSAVNGLLNASSLTAENAFLSLTWFDKEFPLDGWDPTTMPFGQSSYRDYRLRVRALIERMTGTADAAATVKEADTDGWTEAAKELRGLPEFEGYHAAKKLIPVISTLTNAARRAKVQPATLDQPTLLQVYADALKGEHASLQRAVKLLVRLRVSSAVIAARFPRPLEPIEPKGPFRYNVPLHFRSEIEHFVEFAARKSYIRIKKIHTYVAPATRVGFRTTMHAVVDALVAAGHLNSSADSIAAALARPAALEDIVRIFTDRVETGAISARHATTLINRLPIILERNGLLPDPLRDLISELDELTQHASKVGMPERVKRHCRKLIENRSYRLKFLLAHAPPRQAAQAILDGAKGRELSASERAAAIRFGVVALFCAIEIGGAPARVENVLEMPYGGPDAWLRHKDKGFEAIIPATHTKNGEEIRFTMAHAPDKHQFTATVAWYLDRIRPLILKAADDAEPATSPWLIPMLSDPTRPCPYETFHGWFVRIMRDLVGVPCLPHNYRHGQASLLYHRYPERIGWIAVRLGDTENTVLSSYAWVHGAKVMAAGQKLVTDLIEN